MNQYQFDFSVIMAVYNVEAYLEEAVESLVNQTLGFSRIQLILVDDGSPDGSGAICDAYQKKHPENITVIHKENGGVSSARNAGLACAKGKFLNFMDSDDKMDPEVFQKVLDFFDMHGDATDVVGIPMCFFEGRTGEHQQNGKFRLGKDLLDLYETWDVTNLSASASFVRAEAAKGIIFDARLRTAEDAKYILAVLMKKMTLGLVPEGAYWYRRRKSGPESAIQTSARLKEWYIPHIEYFCAWALDAAQELFGEVPRFVQYEVMYDLQWKFKQNKIPEGVLTDQQEEAYKHCLFRTAGRIDDDVILRQKNISLDRKLYILSKKYGYDPEPRQVSDLSGNIKDIVLYYGDTEIVSVANMRTVLEFVRFDTENRVCTVEGYHAFYGADEAKVESFLKVGGEQIICEQIDRPEKSAFFLGEKISWCRGFRGKVPLTGSAVRFSTAVRIGNVRTERKKIIAGPFFPISPVYRNSYFLFGEYMLSLQGYSLCVEKKPMPVLRFIREIRFLGEIWRKNLLGGRKAFFGRIGYHILICFKRKKIWLLSDRIVKADDNGEALFRYLCKNPPADTKLYFVLKKESSDYAGLSRVGKCIDAMTYRHKFLHLFCDVNISSAADTVTINPYWGHHDALRDLLAHQKFVFLQHGVIVCNLADWLNRYNKNISGFVTTTQREWKSVVEGDYHYPAENIWLTGLPRHDRLYHDEKNVITVMPTWRKYLMKDLDSNTGQWTVSDRFYESEYYQFFNSLLNHDRLLSFLNQRGYTLQFFPHPAMQPMLECFQKDPRVVFLPIASSYREIYAESRMVVTDYSSASYDFSYLRKPVIYCQFDREEFLSGGHVYTRGYFDYDEDGFGEVVFDLKSAVDHIIRYVSDDCRLKEKYRERIDRFFAFHDRNCCRRVTEKIMELQKDE